MLIRYHTGKTKDEGREEGDQRKKDIGGKGRNPKSEWQWQKEGNENEERERARERERERERENEGEGREGKGGIGGQVSGTLLVTACLQLSPPNLPLRG